MTNKEIAQKLDGVQYGDAMNVIDGFISNLNKSSIVIVYPYSDDGIEFSGAIRDELSAYNGVNVPLNACGIIKKQCENEYCPHEKDLFKNPPFYIKQEWCKRKGYSWIYETNIPNAEKFNIKEDDEFFGEGLVFDMKDLEDANQSIMEKE